MQVQAAILLVGEYQPLLDTRAQLLWDCEVSTVDARGAPGALRERLYDLLIFCHSVPDSTAGALIALATKLHPDIKVLALSYDGEQRRLGTTTFTSDFYNPELLREAVGRMLSAV
jgi:hypothetical protein